MRPSLIAAAVLTVVVAIFLAACGSDSSTDGGSTSTSGSAPSGAEFGTGLKLGSEVISSAKVGTSEEPWYVWNGDSCSFETTDDHPAVYKADLRTIEGDAPQMGYMHYGNSDPFGIAVSKSIEADAAEAGMPLNVYNLKFPSRTEPVAQANASVIKGDEVVVQANLDPTLLPEFYNVIEGEGCIPSLQLFIPVDDHPAMGNYWPQAGEVIGEYLGQEATARKWSPQETALVQCTDRDSGPTVNALFDEVPTSMQKEGFEVPADNIFNLVCGLTDPQSGYKKVTDWFTANPDFKYAAFTAIDSIRMQEMIRAVNSSGMPREDTLIAAAGDDEASRASVRAGDQDMSVAFFGERYGEWVIPVVEDILAGNPVPAFVGTEMVPLTEANVDQYYPND